ncbi:hypothetical protein Tsubulata_039995 [Turnera subulata]|uniref:SGTA homodimerisation domain-containing protein n=1 Tax=Turnera subulata TaxID=218843 RepID=A0A9Q0G153_9ROSI|nr:hypothetical protein Tsubulata_039995 [Turnera subulata]
MEAAAEGNGNGNGNPPNNRPRTDSPVSRRIVGAFLDFLDSVEAAPGVDLEALQVARECLSAVFNLDDLHNQSQQQLPPPPPGLLVTLFRSLDAAANEHPNSHTPPTTPPNCNPEPPCTMGVSRDELFGQFFAALENINFFRTKPDGTDDPALLDKATLLFHQALNEMENTGCQSFNLNTLAETLKAQGNRAMQSKLYSDAIELYSCAISLSEDNAVYYCNRAAAYTQIQKHAEAIRDCLKSIEIDPKYSKAYSRLGLVYYAQGHYKDAIDKGFKKALELDPNNEAVKENIQVAERKLKEEQQWKESYQHSNPSSHDNQEFNQSKGPASHGVPPPFSSMFEANGNPADFTNMLLNMAANSGLGEHLQEGQGEDRNSRGSAGPEINIGGNIPEELRGAFRSMMDMFSGVAPQGNAQDNATGRPSTS